MWGILWITWILWFLWIAWALVLCYFDFRYQRLPNFLTLPAGVASLWWFTPWGLLWAGLYLLLGLWRDGGIGGGDIKLAWPLGMMVATLAGPGALLAAILFANLFTVLQLLIFRPARRAPHGPAMLLAAGLACVIWG